MAATEPTMKTISTGEKVVLQRRIHTIEFRDKEEDLKHFRCVQCHQVAIFHIALQCSHVACDDCFTTLYSGQCPVSACSKQVTASAVENKHFEEALSELNVTCRNLANGCPEVMSLCNLLAHERCCQYSHQLEEAAKDSATYKQQMRCFQRQFLEMKKAFDKLQQSPGQPFPQEDEVTNRYIAEEVRKECAKEQLKIEKKFSEKFQHLILQQMEMMQSKSQTLLLSKQEKDFQNLKEEMWDHLHGLCDTLEETRSITLMECSKEQQEIEKKLTEKFQHLIRQQMDMMQSKSQTALLSKQEKDFQNLKQEMRGHLHGVCDTLEETTSTRVMEELVDKVERLKKDLECDISVKTNDIKNSLQETSKDFIKGVLDVKCPEMEKRSLNTLIKELQMNSNSITEKVKNYLNDEVKKTMAIEKQALLRNVKDEVGVKCQDEKVSILSELQKGLKQKYKDEKEDLKNDVIRTINYSQLQNDVTSISQQVHMLMMPRSIILIWDIEDFKNKIDDEILIIQSDVFHIPEFGCKVRFKLKLKPDLGIHVEYLEQAKDELHPFNGHLRITFTLKEDQVEDNKYKDFIRIFEPSFNNWMTNVMLDITGMTKDGLSFYRSRWLKDGKIQMRVTLEPLVHLVVLEPRQYGSLIWKIDHYSDVRESFSNNLQYLVSESFYSSEKGYRLKGLCCIGSSVNFLLYFLKGPWDKKLSKKFKHRTTLCIISQDDQGELKDKTFTKETDSLEIDLFRDVISEEDLKKYVKNDTLIVSFKIESRG